MKPKPTAGMKPKKPKPTAGMKPKPTVGSIVIYTAPNGADWAAIVNSLAAVSTNPKGAELVRSQNPLGKLAKGEKIRPNLTVMTALTGDFSVVAAREGKGPGCWRWPG